MQTLWDFRDWLISASQYPPGWEWFYLFQAVAYLWLVFRTGLFGTRYGPRKVTGFDSTVAILTAIVLLSVLGSQIVPAGTP